ncbi:MAG: hypothetical protein KAJ93_02495 [Methanosarcinales archaeon]|nr:hypothetical protein [Methanosarcinales archaeon]
MAKKTREQYEAEIRTLHHTIKEYGDIPEVTKLKASLDRKLGRWFELLDICIIVANNEQTPWTTEELGFSTRPMPLKLKSGQQQVGDYQIFVNGTQHKWYSSLLVERKGCTYERDKRSGLTMIGCDLYSTMMNKAGRERFYREIDRFKQDSRFDQMVVMCECTYDQFLQFTPKFTGKKFNRNHVGASVASRVATINGLFERGVSVRFMGSRKRAIEAYRSAVRLNVIGCYERFIEL